MASLKRLGHDVFCYLAAEKPVATQDTGFGKVVPTGAGLFAFSTMEEAVVDRVPRCLCDETDL